MQIKTGDLDELGLIRIICCRPWKGHQPPPHTTVTVEQESRLSSVHCLKAIGDAFIQTSDPITTSWVPPPEPPAIWARFNARSGAGSADVVLSRPVLCDLSPLDHPLYTYRLRCRGPAMRSGLLSQPVRPLYLLLQRQADNA